MYAKTTDVVARKVAGEIVLVPIRGNLADMQRVFTLNPVAEHIWHMLDGQRSLAQVHEEILREFEVSSEQALEDMDEFMQALVEQGLASRKEA